MKKIIAAALALLMLVFALASCNTAGTETSTTSSNTTNKPSSTEKPTSSVPDAWKDHKAPTMEEIDFSTLDNLKGVNESANITDYVLIKVKDYGTILVRLFPDVAPLTVANFQKLVLEKFYDGIIFHRVIRNFMIQGGDPTGTGYSGSGASIKGEFSENGFENNLLHKKGVISMARTNDDPDSASSQFFICHKTTDSLNKKYAAFGYVVFGLDVVDAIASVATDKNDKPKTDVVIESIRFASVPETSAK